MKNEAENIANRLMSLTSFEPGFRDTIEEQRKKIQSSQLLKDCGLPKRHSQPIIPHGEKWLEAETKLKAKIGTGFIIALCGQRGTGKTQLAASLAKECAIQNRSSKYITAMEFFLDIKESFRPDSQSNEKEVIANFARPKLLIIDETQERGETKWEDGLLTHLVDRRYRDEKDTLLISNQNKESFVESIGPSIASRIIETGGIILCNWPSFRNGPPNQNHRLINV